MAQNDVPVIQAVEPMSVCQGCVMQVVGSRLADNDMHGTHLLLLRDRQTITAAVSSFSRSLDGQAAGEPETVTFGVPPNAMTGPWQLIVERNGRRSAPVTIHILDWVPPTLDALSPVDVAPGQSVTLTGGNFPAELFVDLLEQGGSRVSRFNTTAAPQEAALALPEGTPEGSMLVRIGARRDGVEWYSQALPLKVTAVPNVSIDVGMMAPVAPGQWTVLVMDGNSERIAADRVDVEFRQGQEVRISSRSLDQDGRVRVPPTLAAGLVNLRARVWRAGRSSPWSQTVAFDLLPSPAEAVIHAIGVVRDGNPFAWWSRIDAPAPLEVRPGDRLLVGGEFPFASPRLAFTGHSSPNESIPLQTIKARGDSIEVEVPQLAAGEWTLRVQSEEMTTSGGAGVVMRVER
jgi:hypothetical protein